MRTTFPRRRRAPNPGRFSLATLCHLGWLEIPSIPTFTRTRYLRYNQQLHDWATHTQIPAELLEIWLAQNWQERTRTTGRHYRGLSD
ncbi:MAG: hypothetical protein KDB44_08730 [Mycobacterium sp.]|nr:hypothetical protein [Mycobacterium sp.]